MTIAAAANISMIQGTGQATTAPATTSQTPNTRQSVQDAARELREAIRNNVDQEIIAAKAQATARAALAQTAAQAPPPPTGPREFVFRGPNGQQTTVGLPPSFPQDTIPPQAVDISIAFFLTVAAIIIGLPLARAFARRMDRRGGSTQISNEVSSQLAHLSQAVDAIALEVERISEGQRYTTRLLSEQRDPARQTLPSAANR